MNTAALPFSRTLPSLAANQFRGSRSVLRLEIWVILLALVCAPAPAPCRDDLRAPAKLDVAAIDRAVTGQMTKQQIVGTAVGVLVGGKVVLTKGYGYANLESAQPVTTESVFNWASNSKPLMAVAAMQLVQQGLLDLDADVRRYVPEFPAQSSVIKVRHLLCHQSGIPHYSNGRVIPLSAEPPTPAATLDPVVSIHVFARSPLLFAPGEKFSYSTYAYILLSAVVQRAGKLPIAAQLEKRIVGPLKMGSFQLDLPFNGQTNWVLAYGADASGKQTRVPDEAHFWKHGGGGYKSNIRDFAKWAEGLLGSTLVNRKTGRQMWTIQPTNDGEPTIYGLGFKIERREGVQSVSHGGSQEETKTHLVIFPAQKSGVVVMCNAVRGRAESIASAVLAVIPGPSGL